MVYQKKKAFPVFVLISHIYIKTLQQTLFYKWNSGSRASLVCEGPGVLLTSSSGENRGGSRPQQSGCFTLI